MSNNPLLCNHTKYKRAVYFTNKDHVSMVLTAKRTYSADGVEDDVTTLQSKEHVVAYMIEAEPVIQSGFYENRLSYHELKNMRMNKDIQLNYAKICVNEDSCVYKFDGFEIRFKVYVEKPNGYLKGLLVQERLEVIPPEVLTYLAGFNNPLERYNLLPSGYGWDGVRTGLELITARKIQQLIIGDYRWEGISDGFITKIQDASIFTPSKMIELDWCNAISVDRKLDRSLRIGERNPESEIFIIGQNAGLSKLLSSDSDIARFDLPDEFDRCVLIKTNMIKNPKLTYGVNIQLFKYT